MIIVVLNNYASHEDDLATVARCCIYGWLVKVNVGALGPDLHVQMIRVAAMVWVSSKESSMLRI